MKNKQLFMYGEIGIPSNYTEQRSFDAKDFKSFVDSIDTKDNLDLFLNSPGGSVDDALSIKAFIESHKGSVNIKIEGICASAATLITCSKNAKVSMSKGSLFMIHNPSTIIWGDKHDAKAGLNALEKRSEEIAYIYSQKSNLDKDKLLKMMDEETWLTADEALEYGFIDEIEEQNVSMVVNNNTLMCNGVKFDLNSFLNFPKITKGENRMSNPTPQPQDTNDHKATVNKQINTVEQLMQAYPELCKQLQDQAIQQGIKAERLRLQELDELDCPFNMETINKAKYETFANAKDCAVEILKQQKQQRMQMLKDRIDDAKDLNDIATGQNDNLDKSSNKQQMVKNLNQFLD